MRRSFYILLLIISGLAFACSNVKKVDDVVFYDAFPGARLDTIENLGNDSYITYFSPAFEPVNKSPWYAFAVSAKSDREIEVQLNYGEYKHRYIPKLSKDRKSWKVIDNRHLKVDTITGVATLKLNVSPEKLYVAAQEIESTEDTYSWIDNMLNKHTDLELVIAGKTVLKNDNYCLKAEKESNKKAIVLIARQHPPEIPGGTIGFKVFFETLMARNKLADSFRAQYNIYTFPLLNPDGVDLGNWRHNAQGVDLNRDWVEFTQPETKMVRTYLSNKVNKGIKIKFAMDFHTSHSGPYLLVLDSINEAKTEKITADWIQKIEELSNFDVEARKRSQDLPYCYNWFYNTFGSEAVTYEDGDEIDRDIIKQRAKTYAEQLMETMILMQDNNEYKN